MREGTSRLSIEISSCGEDGLLLLFGDDLLVLDGEVEVTNLLLLLLWLMLLLLLL